MGCCASATSVQNSSSERDSRSLVGSKDIELTPEKTGHILKKEYQEIVRRRSAQHFSQNIVIENEDKDIRDYYDIDKMPVLGSGISGSVKVCIHKATRIKFALKILSKKALKPEKISKLKQEIQFMADLDHPNILRINEYFETKDVIYLILELCRGGELLDRLHEQKGHHYSEKVACRYIHTMLSAVAYCHAHNIVHRDLKLENFLFESASPDSELKLIDFGLSQYFKPKEVLHSSVGTPYYVAPEVLEGSYDAKCDIWSIGVIAYMLLSGTPPFFGKTDADTLQSVKQGKWRFDDILFKPVSVTAKSFITACLNKRVSKRLSAMEALRHNWFDLLRSELSVFEVSLNVISRLKTFRHRSSLAKVCMEVVAHTLLPDQIADLRKEFVKIDSTETGQISYADLKRVLEGHGSFSDEDLEFIFKGIDFNHTGDISYHEFLAATISSKNLTEENLKVAFDKMSSHNLFISSEDILDLLGMDGSESEVERMLSENDLKPSSKIYFEQFKQIMSGNQSPMIKSPYRKHKNKITFFGDESSSPSNTPIAKSVQSQNQTTTAVVTSDSSTICSISNIDIDANNGMVSSSINGGDEFSKLLNK